MVSLNVARLKRDVARGVLYGPMIVAGIQRGVCCLVGITCIAGCEPGSELERVIGRHEVAGAEECNSQAIVRLRKMLPLRHGGSKCPFRGDIVSRFQVGLSLR